MPYIQETTTAGVVKEVRKYHSHKYQPPKETRRGQREVTPEEMRRINEQNAARKLRLLLLANFREDDFYLTLTYSDSELPDAEQAKQNFAKFLRRLRDFYKKLGVSLKYVGVTEYQGKRLHHHLLINAVDGAKKSQIAKLWQHGFIKKEDFGGDVKDCRKLANYFIKESNNTFRAPERVHGLRWIASKNLARPKVEKKIVKANSWKEEPRPIKGYYLEKESIEEWVTKEGYHCQFYCLIKIRGREDG